MEPSDLYQEMREACARVAEAQGLDRECFNWAALISLGQVRNGMIRSEYRTKRQPGNTDGVKEELSKKYGLSSNYIQIILYGKRV